MDGGTWWATVYGVAKSQTRLSGFSFALCGLRHWITHPKNPLEARTAIIPILQMKTLRHKEVNLTRPRWLLGRGRARNECRAHAILWCCKNPGGQGQQQRGQASRLRDLSLLPAAGHRLRGPVGAEWPHPKARLSLLSYQGRQRACQPGGPSPGETWQIPAQEAGRGKEQGRGE